MTVITSEVPVRNNETLKAAPQIKIASRHLKNTIVKKEMRAINSKHIKSFRAGTLDKAYIFIKEIIDYCHKFSLPQTYK